MRRDKPQRVALDIRGLTGHQEIFRIGAGAKRDAAVDAWLNDSPVELRSIACTWFTQMRRCGDDVRECMHDGAPVACVDDAPFAYVNAFTRHVNVGFFYGATLNDPTGLLLGSGRRMRHVKLIPEAAPADEALRTLILAAYEDIKSRLDAEAAAKEGSALPPATR